MPSRPTVLVVDDVPANLVAMKTILRGIDADLVTAESGPEALACVLEHDLSLILLDVQMPGMDGFEVAEIIRANPDFEHIPIIFVTAAARELQDHVRGYELGAFDYVEKPVNTTLMVSKVGVFLELGRARADQKRLLDELEHEVVERERAEAEARHLSLTDELTGLPNRRAFLARAAEEHKAMVRHGTDLSLAMIDIDHFKRVNDTVGHEGGDDVLRGVADLFRRWFRESDVVGRVGGEEFAALLRETSAESAAEVVERLREAAEAMTVETSRGPVTVTLSAGVTSVSGADESIDAAFRRADGLLYHSKGAGRNRVTIG